MNRVIKVLEKGYFAYGVRNLRLCNKDTAQASHTILCQIHLYYATYLESQQLTSLQEDNSK